MSNTEKTVLFYRQRSFSRTASHRFRRHDVLTRENSGPRAYCQSKLAQIMFTFDLAQQMVGSQRGGELPSSCHLYGYRHGQE